MATDQTADAVSVGSAAASQRETRSRPRSLISRRSRSRGERSQTRSRPRTPDAGLHRVYSSAFHDDHGAYISPDDYAPRDDEVADDPTDDPNAGSRTPTEKVKDGVGEEEEEEEEEAREEVASDLDEPMSASPSDEVRKAEEVDLEKGRPPPLDRQQTNKSSKSARSQRDPNLVSWNGPDDPENPKNWTNKRKWVAVFVVSSFTFISPVSSSMVAPALPAMANDLGVTAGSVVSQMMLSIFVLAYAVGPLFLGPLSEMYGRVPVLQLANLFFLIFNLVCGFAQTSAQMLVFRFLSGLGGSAPLAIGGGILADCFHPEHRGKAVAIYSLAPLIGPAAGPIAGGFIAENTTWRWTFWAVSIVDAAIQISGLFFLQETWAPKLLANKAKKLRKETGNQNLYSEAPTEETVLHKLRTSIARPFRMLFTQPIVMALGIYMAYLYGLTYLVISTFPTLFTSPQHYNESVGIGGLHYIALALGYFIGAQTTSRLNDWLYRRLKHRNGGKGLPEFRVPVMILCAILLPVGFFWYGWSAEAKIFWIMPDIGAAILAASTICGFQAIQTYAIDAYTKYAASAIAAIACLRSLAGFGFPLFAPAMYNALGYGWGNSLLAFVAIAIGLPAPWIFWTYGAKMRAKSQYAAGT